VSKIAPGRRSGTGSPIQAAVVLGAAAASAWSTKATLATATNATLMVVYPAVDEQNRA
jgi:hypothetical protein